MSKASDWLAAKAAWYKAEPKAGEFDLRAVGPRTSARPGFYACAVEADGAVKLHILAADDMHNCGVSRLTPEQALGFARWILDTFADTTP